MKPFKYKIWYKINNIFLNPEKYDHLYLNYNGELIYGDGRGDDILDLEKYEISYSTGLCDKNGKEVYEGDILKSICGQYASIIEYSDRDFMINEIDNRVLNGFTSKLLPHLFDEYCGDKEYKMHLWTPCGCIIVGNKFENPELLEDLK